MVLAAALLSTGGVAVKACGFGAWQICGLRSLIAGAMVFALLPESRRGWDTRVLGVSVAYAATLVLFVLANKRTTAAHAIFLQSSAPLYVWAMGAWWLGERPQRGELGPMGLVLLGLVLFVSQAEPATAIATQPAVGNAMAMCAGLTWAAVVVGLRALAMSHEEDQADRGLATAVLGNALTAAVCLPIAWPLEAGTAVDWSLVGFLGVFQLGLAYVLMTRAVTQLRALEVSMWLLLEPVASAVWAATLLGEVPRPTAWFGAVALVTGLAWQNWRANQG
jgi:drug/metabolite transporter (DMT)-like permease